MTSTATLAKNFHRNNFTELYFSKETSMRQKYFNLKKYKKNHLVERIVVNVCVVASDENLLALY